VLTTHGFGSVLYEQVESVPFLQHCRFLLTELPSLCLHLRLCDLCSAFISQGKRRVHRLILSRRGSDGVNVSDQAQAQ
jgi:hypothetical protein